MTNIQRKEFISWLINRLQLKHNEDNEVIRTMKELQEKYCYIPKTVSISDIDNIGRKYYADYDMPASEKMGYTDHERNSIRNLVVGIIKDAGNL